MSTTTPVWPVLVAAPVAALAVWALAVPVAGVDLAAGDPAQPVGPVAVAVVALVVTLAAWGVRTLLFREHRKGWWITCGALLLVSLIGPAGAASASAATWLAAMHLTVAAVIVVGLAPRGRTA